MRTVRFSYKKSDGTTSIRTVFITGENEGYVRGYDIRYLNNDNIKMLRSKKPCKRTNIVFFSKRKSTVSKTETELELASSIRTFKKSSMKKPRVRLSKKSLIEKFLK